MVVSEVGAVVVVSIDKVEVVVSTLALVSADDVAAAWLSEVGVATAVDVVSLACSVTSPAADAHDASSRHIENKTTRNARTPLSDHIGDAKSVQIGNLVVGLGRC